MSEQGPVPSDNPAVAGPEQEPGTAEQQEFDWQKQYAELQPEYTRATQELAQLREQQQLYDLLLSSEDPDTRRQVAEALGYVLEDEETQQPDDDDIDPLERYDERLGRLEETLTERDEAEAEAEYADQVRQIVDEQLDQLELDKDDQDWVLAYAINALPITDDGLPDIEQAYKVFVARETERQRNWAKSKRAPRISPNGQSATEAPNLDNRQDRQEWMVRRLQEQEQAGY